MAFISFSFSFEILCVVQYNPIFKRNIAPCDVTFSLSLSVCLSLLGRGGSRNECVRGIKQIDAHFGE